MEEEEIMDVRDGGVASEIDPFNHPTPGQSLTQEAGRPFEGPAETNDPEQVIAKIIAFFENPEEKDILISTLISGMPVEAIVQTFALGGVSEGKFSPDVAELIKPALTIHILNLAMEEGIPVQIFTDEVVSDEIREATLDAETRENVDIGRPELGKLIKGRENLDRVKERLDEVKGKNKARNRLEQIENEIPVESDGSFMEIGE